MAPTPSSHHRGTSRQNHLQEFRQWVHSLTWQDLETALEVRLNDESDLELVTAAIRAQVGPPTPIHPRAVPSWASKNPQQQGSYEARFATDYERWTWHRRHRPRLLKLVPQVNPWTMPLMKQPPQAQQPQQPIRKGRRNKGKIRSSDPLSSSSSSSSTQQQQQQYDVLGKAFVALTRDGTLWGVPPLERLRRADWDLLRCTTLCSALDGTETVFLRVSSSSRGRETPQQHENNNNKKKKWLLELLRVASRGNFLTREQRPDARFPTWLRPTEDWWSLGKFLAARLEMALVQSFARVRRQQQQQQEPVKVQSLWYQPSFVQRLQGAFSNPGEVGSLVATLLRNSILAPDAVALPQVRDCLIHSLLLERPALVHDPTENPGLGECATLGLWMCPLLRWGSVSAQCCALARHEVHRLLARKMEEELLKDDSTGDNDDCSILQRRPASTKPGKKKRSKKRNKQQRRPNKLKQPPSTPPRRALCKWDEETNTDCEKELQPPSAEPLSSSSDDDDDDATQQISNQAMNFPDTAATVSDRTRNRNIVMVMGVLEDVVSDVFREVGLTGNGDDDDDDNVAQKQNGDDDGGGWGDAKSLKKQLQKAKPVPTRDDPRVPQPMPRQNKAAATKTFNNQAKTDHTSDEEQIPPLETISSTSWPDLPQTVQHPNTQQPAPAHFDESQVSAAMSNSQTTSTRGALDIFASPYGNLAGGFFLRSPEKSIDFAWDTHDFAFDQWGLGGSTRERSIMNDLFLSLERREQETEENIMASSTIASIASSTNDDAYIENADALVDDELTETIEQEPEFPGVEEEEKQFGDDVKIQATPVISSPENSAQDVSTTSTTTPSFIEVKEERKTSLTDPVHPMPGIDAQNERHQNRSPSPQAPSTPSPTLSPILVSLADLQEMRKSGSSSDLQEQGIRNSNSFDSNTNEVRSFSSVPGPANLLNSPRVVPPRMVTSLSRENLRAETDETSSSKPRTLSYSRGETVEAATHLKSHPPPLRRSSSAIKYSSPKARDDNDIKSRVATRRRSDALESYRTVASRSLVKSRDDNDVVRSTRPAPTRLSSYRAVPSKRADPKQTHIVLGNTPMTRDIPSAKSEAGNEDFAPNWQDSRRSSLEEADNNTTTRDGSTTITSALSHQKESEETLREERDTYRDLCLTLGAEVSKLKNLLASQNHLLMSPQTLEFSQQYPHAMMIPNSRYGPTNYFDHPASLDHLAQKGRGSKTLTAMSDAEYRAEHESMASEDEIAAGGMVSHQRHVSSGATATSDASVEYSAQNQLNFTVGIPNLNHRNELPVTGVQSRLSIDIMHFVDVINNQLRKQGTRRMKAAERMTRLVTALWPRAQCKLYGSHVTGLSLPTSDVDFVICLPAVQKDAPAVAPGVLEGRNAINETSQKMLARKLKNESWIDPRSMKLIERTVVPVIKVATKDTKAKTLQLDITFDAPSHHGLEAVELVNHLLVEFPMIRPLVLVLKKFLLDRGLLTGYTGGLSSYCLFLMTARYLQEQAASWADCGALLMGFLDFYGNHFDPRTTGISVRLGQYFARPNYAASAVPQQPPQMMWNPATAHPPFATKVEVNGFPEKSYVRRNSFSDKGNVDGLRGATTGAPSSKNGNSNQQFQPVGPPTTLAPNIETGGPDHGMPYTFDPLFVEDPLAMGNNVGRNTFRIFQVLRAFSDAHRGLVASLEWDLQSSDDLEDVTEYPLLKCLLQSEDVVYDL